MKNNPRNSLKSRVKKFLKLENVELNLFEKFLLPAPVFIWFSYQPLIHFAQNSTMNFELSLTLIYVATLGILAIPEIVKSRKVLLKNRFFVLPYVIYIIVYYAIDHCKIPLY